MSKTCIGCGAPLTNDKDLCERCFKLKHYGVYEETSKNNTDYLKIIEDIPKTSLIIYVTSLINVNIKDLSEYPNTILVLTKKDLLPKSVQDYKLIDYFKKHYPNFQDIEVISATHNYNIDKLYNKIIKHSNQTPVYVIGYTNSGKSTLINKLIQTYSDKNIDITTSIYPSTTLDKITIPINDDLTLIDTPGLLSSSSVISHIAQTMLKKITPKKTIKPRTYQLKGKGSLIIENILRFDYDTRNTSMTIYIANAVNITRVKPENSKMHDIPKQIINIDDHQDLLIEDLCFIKFTNRTKVTIYCPYQIKFNTRDNLI